MSKLPAFRELQDFIGEQTARKPSKKPKPKRKNANGRRIVAHFQGKGHFATCSQQTGPHRDGKQIDQL